MIFPLRLGEKKGDMGFLKYVRKRLTCVNTSDVAPIQMKTRKLGSSSYTLDIAVYRATKPMSFG